VNEKVIVPPSSLHFLLVPEYEMQETATELDQATLLLYVIRESVADTVVLVTPVVAAGELVRVNVLVGEVTEAKVVVARVIEVKSDVVSVAKVMS
jgi:hypothetical protein